MINLEEPTKERLDNILHQLDNGVYLIPDFQRDYDWNAQDIKELLISIFSDYYIGNLLLWRTNDSNVSALCCKNIFGYKNENLIKSNTVVLDGQQRLTSLYYAFFNPNKKNLKQRKSHVEFFINIEEFEKNNMESALFFEWKKNKLKNLNNIEYLVKNKIYPLTNFPIVTQRRNDWFDAYEAEYGKDQTNNLADKFAEICKYQIPIIELKQELEISKVCDIFEKINSKGVKLSTFDLLNSILKQHDINLRTNLWENAKKELEFIDDDNKMYILQNISIKEQNYCSPKFLYYLVPGATKIVRDNFGNSNPTILIKDKDEFINRWNEAIDSLKKAELILKNDSISGYGILKAKFFPYKSMIAIFSALYSYIKNAKGYDNKINLAKLKQWWYYSIFTNSYSGSVESTLAKDYQDVKKWFNNVPNDIKDSIDDFVLHHLNLDLSDEKPGSAIYNAILNLIITNGATDFYNNEALELNKLEDHHIVPKAFCEKLGIDSKKYNSILNRTLIMDGTNNNIKDDMPCAYIMNKIVSQQGSLDDTQKMLEKHFVSKEALDILLKKDFDKNDFDEFLKKRNEAIIKYVKDKIFLLEKD